jgi:hypothetical protein
MLILAPVAVVGQPPAGSPGLTLVHVQAEGAVWAAQLPQSAA